MSVRPVEGGLDIVLGGRLLVRHRADRPWLYAGRGEERIAMRRGHFDIEDYVVERVPLVLAAIEDGDASGRLVFHRPDGAAALEAVWREEAGRLVLSFTAMDPSCNRLWVRLEAEAGEAVWGCGEQFSYFNLRGRHFPLWTREPGVGRDRASLAAYYADLHAGAGGDYHTTYYPQPTFLSSRRYACHVETSAYADFDFRHAEFHELQVWAVPERLEFSVADRIAGLVEGLSLRFGCQPPLPDWVHDGVILGLKRGEKAGLALLDKVLAHGVPVSALWCEDWVGLRVTEFGQRLFWDWRWNPARYPTLERTIAGLKARGIRFLGYVNPYLCVDGTRFAEAAARGFLVRTADGAFYRLDFGGFECAMVDFTDPHAAAWFKDTILRAAMLDFGLDGWMADFGEYLPTDAVLANGVDGSLMHNRWPVLWARVNAEAVAEAGRRDDVLFFMRAGFTGIQAHCPLLWAGDQLVDFSRHDGMGTALCAALSSGLLGNAFHHSDIGGYTSLFGTTRSAELFLRWAEMAVFSAAMRTHEGNRPDENFQIHQDAGALAIFARLVRLHVALKPYLRALVDEAGRRGLPLQRPLVLHFEDDPAIWSIQDAYLFGPDMLVAPVLAAGVDRRDVILPQGARWRHLWSGEAFEGGQTVSIPAVLGYPPAFSRTDSAFAALFCSLTDVV